MFIVSLTYRNGPEAADAHLAGHIEWLKDGYAQGLFLASGRKVPRTGGVILAEGDRATLDAFLAADPFAVHGVADYDVTEVAFSMAAEGLERLKD
ncbi:GTP cyclohydrolase [Rhizobium rhizosphaerae]|uniref:GTP cyclohydrolase n=1 Tax=Xaviernesmea rhizosphaerae TaxID=1672749 RepID=A0ABX3PCY3_9HYPH|nr:YciI family protein [Xaviernesmea rhizosphaerae]OQP86315.1 GTP cyclohydrolase [Xaviernesmea rhizosphaerae]